MFLDVFKERTAKGGMVKKMAKGKATDKSTAKVLWAALKSIGKTRKLKLSTIKDIVKLQEEDNLTLTGQSSS